MGASIIAACGVSRRDGEAWLLREASLAVAAGERVALMGPSGSGKTLLLRAMALLDPFDDGEILWHGRRVPDREVPAFRSRVVYLQQRPDLPEGSVEQILRQPYSLAVHRGRQFDPRPIRSHLEKLKRDAKLLTRRSGDLSGGEAQLVALLRAVQLEPDVLLLDEPTSALDPQSAAAVETLVDSWAKRQPGRRSVVWVTHDPQQARRVADVVRQIRAGEIQEQADDALR